MPKNKSMKRQVLERLTSFQAFGQSKHKDKAANGGKPAMGKIYSHSTMKNYLDAGIRFAEWAKTAHGCRSLDSARQYAGEYLSQRMSDGKSAWTVRRDAAALGKLYQCQTTAFDAALPTRARHHVTQHRDKSTWKGRFSEANHADLVNFCKGTGLRRRELASVTASQVVKNTDGSVTIRGIVGKGGKVRDVPVLPKYANHVMRMAEAAEGRSAIAGYIPDHMPVHAYRAEYAQSMYNNLARDVSTLPKSEKYICRSDRSGVSYDRAAMGAVSVALGHNRLDVMTSYLKE